MSRDAKPPKKKEGSPGILRRWKTDAVRGLRAMAGRHPSITLAVQAIREFSRHRMTLTAAYFAYHCFMAIFPLLLLVSAILGFVLKSDPALQQEIINHILELFPDFGGTLKSILDGVVASRHLVGTIGLLGLLWAGTRIAKSLEIGTCIIWETDKRRYWKRKLLALGILFILGFLGAVAIGFNLASSSLMSWMSKHASPLWTSASFVVSTLLSLTIASLILTAMYILVPQERPEFREAAGGALVAAVLFHIIDYGFSYYFVHMAKTQALYGTIGVIIGVLIWLYLIGIVIFLGAELVHLLSLRKTATKNGKPSPAGGSSGESACSIDSE